MKNVVTVEGVEPSAPCPQQALYRCQETKQNAGGACRTRTCGPPQRPRLSKPLPWTNSANAPYKNFGAPGGIRTLKTLFLRQGRIPVPSPGQKKKNPLRLCPRAITPSGAVFRCTWRRPGLPRTSPPPPSPAVATTACTGTAEVGRTTSRHAKGCVRGCRRIRCKAGLIPQCAGPALRQVVKQRLAATWCGPRGAITVCVEREKTKPENKNGPETFRLPGPLGAPVSGAWREGHATRHGPPPEGWISRADQAVAGNARWAWADFLRAKILQGCCPTQNPHAQQRRRRSSG